MAFSVAVLIATYNGERYIRSQIGSILSQEGVLTHLFFRDDGSSDSTLDIIAEFKIKYPARIHIIDDSMGPYGSPGKNFLAALLSVDMCEYDYLSLSDQDDIWLPDKIMRAVNELNDTRSDGYSCDLMVWDGSYVRGSLSKSHAQTEYDHLFQTASAGCTYVITRRAALLVQNRVCGKLNYLKPSVAHDLIIYSLVRQSGMLWCHDKYCGVYYRQHCSNFHGAQSWISKLINLRKVAMDNWYGDIVSDNMLILERYPRFMDDIFSRNFIKRLSVIRYVGGMRREKLGCLAIAFMIMLGLLRGRNE